MTDLYNDFGEKSEYGSWVKAEDHFAARAEIARLHDLLKDAQSDCDFFTKREQILEHALKALADRAEIHSDLTCSADGRVILAQARGALE